MTARGSKRCRMYASCALLKHLLWDSPCSARSKRELTSISAHQQSLNCSVGARHSVAFHNDTKILKVRNVRSMRNTYTVILRFPHSALPFWEVHRTVVAFWEIDHCVRFRRVQNVRVKALSRVIFLDPWGPLAAEIDMKYALQRETDWIPDTRGFVFHP